MFGRRKALQILGVSALGVTIPSAAEASVVRAVRLEELVRGSRRVLVVTPLDAYSVWETIGDQRRIVTYTRARFDDHVRGEAPGETEILVRTLGGRVGKTGQVVHGEAQLRLREASLVFLRRRPDGNDGVTAMAQGHYPLRPDAGGVLRLRASPTLPELLDADGGAVSRLRDTSFAEAIERIRGAKAE